MSLAGDYHTGAELVCAECHNMHYSQDHGYNADGTGEFTALTGGPHEYLLRDDVNNLCLACHDGEASAPDVFEAHGNGYVRQAGALNEVGGGTPYFESTGHTLYSMAEAPGSDPAWSNPTGMTCCDCHSAHGSGLENSYRNLGGYGTVPGPGTEISYSRLDVEGSNDLTKWVFEDVSVVGSMSAHYGVDGVTFNEPDPTASAYAGFCKACHTNFHGDVGGVEIGGTGSPAAEFVRHPCATANIGAHVGDDHSSLTRLAGKTNQAQVMSPTGQRAGSYDGTDTGLTPSCFSCHKGHGNQNSFGLVFILGTGTMSEEGDDGADVRNTCRQCHTQGGTSALF